MVTVPPSDGIAACNSFCNSQEANRRAMEGKDRSAFETVRVLGGNGEQPTEFGYEAAALTN